MRSTKYYLAKGFAYSIPVNYNHLKYNPIVAAGKGILYGILFSIILGILMAIFGLGSNEKPDIENDKQFDISKFNH